ncbi:hypothetical protein C0584_01590 [Candidatus Parcubacteria bacterium]|nr:MAG: hypothetical protein C0584_01590 [Candidatus Parcubacteria bacterium]
MIDYFKKYIIVFLKWTEKWTNTDMVYLANGGFWLTIEKFFSVSSSFLIAIVFANYLSPEIYGTYRYSLSVITILMISTLSGIDTSVTRTVAQGNEMVVKKAITEKAKWGVLGSIISLFLSFYYFTQNDITLSVIFLISVVFVPFLNNLDLWAAYLFGKKNFQTIAKYKIFGNFLNFFPLLIATVFTKNIYIILSTFLVFGVLSKIILIRLTLKNFPPNKNKDESFIKYGKHLSLMGVLSTISFNIDKILIFNLLGPVQLAIYSFATRPISEITSFLGNFSNIFLPKLSQRKMDDLKKTLLVKSLKFSIVLIPIIVLYYLSSPLIFRILFHQYEDAVIYSQLFAISLIFFPKVLFGQALIAHAETKKLYFLQTLVPVFRISALFFLTTFFGLMGTILSFILTDIFHIAVLIIIYRDKFWQKIFSKKKVYEA